MNNLRLLFFIVGMSLMPLVTHAQHTLTDADVTFSDGVIVKYNSDHIDIIIPTSINGEEVTGIGDEAFRSKGLTGVVIASSIKQIGEKAFSNNLLTKLVIPNLVVSIGKVAFGNNRLMQLTISNSVRDIGNHAFRNNRLTGVSIPNSVRNIGKHSFRGNWLTEVELPSSVTYIGQHAFTNNRILSITLPTPEIEGTWNSESSGGEVPLNRKYIYSADEYLAQDVDFHFENNTILGYYGYGGNIVIPDEIEGQPVVSIGKRAFRYKRLTDVTIPNSVLEIGKSAFVQNNFSKITLPTPDAPGAWSIGNSGDQVSVNKEYVYIIDEPNPDTDFVFEDGVILDYIGSDSRVNIPRTIQGQVVTKIGDDAFHFDIRRPTDVRLTHVHIPNTVTTIGEWAFGANRILEVVIPSSVKVLERGAFRGAGLQKVTIPNSLTSIGESAFAVNSLKSVHIPESVVRVESRAFSSNELTSMDLPSTLTSIGNWAFSWNKIKAVTFPKSVTFIGANAFTGNDLTVVEMPQSIVEIENGVFLRNKIRKLTLADSTTHIGSSAFSDNKLTKINFPSSLERIEWEAFRHNQLGIVTLPNSVTFIGSWAFMGTSFIVPAPNFPGSWSRGLNPGDTVVSSYYEYSYTAAANYIQGNIQEKESESSRTIQEGKINTISIDDLDRLPQAYPNPSSTGKFNIQLSTPARIKVVNIEGVIIQEQQLNEAGDVQIDIEKGVGMYFLQVQTTDKLYIQKLQVR